MTRIFFLLVLLLSGCVSSGADITGESGASSISDVSFKTSDGITIAGTYYMAPGEDAPGIILLHMLSKNRGDWAEFAKTLQAAGYTVLAIDLRGHGDSDLSWKRFSDADFNDMVLDVAAAKKFLVEEGVSGDDLAIIGGSIGANVALKYAADDKEINGVVLLSPGLDYKGVKTEEAITAYGKRPVLIVASRDDLYAAESSKKLHSLALGKSELKIYPGGAHGTSIISAQNAGPMILDWLQEVL